jgi:hypothetical protein
MRGLTQAHVDAARRLLADEASRHAELGPTAAAGRVYERLFDALAPVIGPAGVRALIARSARLNKTEFPCLAHALSSRELPADAEQTSVHLVACLDELEPCVAAKVAIDLYATFLGLMTTFIGERLVTQLLKTAFPALQDIESKESS